jgi:hypothetical protein
VAAGTVGDVDGMEDTGGTAAVGAAGFVEAGVGVAAVGAGAAAVGAGVVILIGGAILTILTGVTGAVITGAAMEGTAITGTVMEGTVTGTGAVTENSRIGGESARYLLSNLRRGRNPFS